MTEREFSRILGWPGYKVYRNEIDETKRTLQLWVRRKRGNEILISGNCGGRAARVVEVRERAIRDLPWRKYQTWLNVEYYRVNCPKCAKWSAFGSPNPTLGNAQFGRVTGTANGPRQMQFALKLLF